MFCFCFFFTNFIFCTRLIVIKYSSTESIYNKYTHCQQSSAAILVSRFILKMNITWGHTTVIKHEHCWINGKKTFTKMNVKKRKHITFVKNDGFVLLIYYVAYVLSMYNRNLPFDGKPAGSLLSISFCSSKGTILSKRISIHLSLLTWNTVYSSIL